MNGETRMVASRSRGDGMVRAAMMPGTAHAEHESNTTNERPLKADPAHDAVDDERRARHVAHVFQQVDQREQDDDLRQKHEYRADSGDDAVCPEIGEKPLREHHSGQPSKLAEKTFDPVHRRNRPGEDALEDKDHHRGEREPTHQRMQKPPVDFVAPCIRLDFRRTDVSAHLVHPLEPLLRRFGFRERLRARPLLGRFERPEERIHPDTAVADNGKDRGPQRFAELDEIDLAAARAHLVDHGDDESGRELRVRFERVHDHR